MRSKKTVIISVLALTLLLAVSLGFSAVFLLKEEDPPTPVNTTICGITYPIDTSEIYLSGSDISSNLTELFKLKDLRYADLTNTGISTEQYEMLVSELPECKIKWSVPICGNYYTNTVKSVTLTADMAASADTLSNIKYLSDLELLDVGDFPLCDELFNVTAALTDSDSGYKYKLSSTLNGVPIDTETVSLDFSKMKITDLSEFWVKLKFFPNIKEVYMGSCKASDQDLYDLNQSLPKTKVVWIVKFAHYQVRSDIQVFSTLVGEDNPTKYSDEKFYPLLNYCTDLKALDLGHNHIKDVASFSKLTNLEVLVLANTQISDLSAIRNLKKLHYLEFFACKGITDLEPLGDLPNLESIELQSIGEAKNLAALERCPKLKLLFLNGMIPTDCTFDEIKEKLPNCIVRTEGISLIESGWRSTAKNQAIKTAFANWELVTDYRYWDDVEYSKPPKQKMKVPGKYWNEE